MIISSQQIQSILQAHQKRLESVGGDESTQAQSRASRADRVELSPGAQELAELVRLVQQLPEVRADVLREVGEALASGTYKVPSSAVAEKMVGRYLADRLQ